MSDDVTKVTRYIPISRELAIAAGIVEPTEEERAEIEITAAKYRAWNERNDRILAEGTAALRRIDNPMIQEILALHAQDNYGGCRECTSDDYGVDWPCSTVRIVANHHGIQMDEPYPII